MRLNAFVIVMLNVTLMPGAERVDFKPATSNVLDAQNSWVVQFK